MLTGSEMLSLALPVSQVLGSRFRVGYGEGIHAVVKDNCCKDMR